MLGRCRDQLALALLARRDAEQRAERGRKMRAGRKTAHQSYIHYNKASVVLYYFKEMIGEKKVNEAMKNLVAKFGYKDAPFPTSMDALKEFKAVTPDSLKYLVSDLFENITLFICAFNIFQWKEIGLITYN